MNNAYPSFMFYLKIFRKYFDEDDAGFLAAHISSIPDLGKRIKKESTEKAFQCLKKLFDEKDAKAILDCFYKILIDCYYVYCDIINEEDRGDTRMFDDTKLKLYKILKKQFEEEDVDKILDCLNYALKEVVPEKREFLELKAEMKELKTEIKTLEAELKSWFLKIFVGAIALLALLVALLNGKALIPF